MADEPLVITVTVDDGGIAQKLAAIERVVGASGDRMAKGISGASAGTDALVKKMVGIPPAAQKSAESLALIDRAAQNAARGGARLGGAIVDGLGPAGVAVRDVAAEVVNLGNGLEGAVARLGFSPAALSSIGVGAGLLAAGAGALTLAASQAADLERAVAGVTLQAGATADEFERAKKATQDLSTQTGLNNDDLGRGLFRANQVSTSRGQAEDLTGAAALGSVAGIGSVEQTVDVLADLRDAFDLNAEPAIDTVNRLFVVAREGRADIGELARSLGRLAPQAHALDVDFNVLASTLALAKRNGGQFSDTTVALEGILAGLKDPTSPLSVKLRDLGESFTAAELKGDGLIRALPRISAALKRSGDEQGTAAALFGGPRTQRGALALLRSESAEATAIVREAQDDTAAFSTAMERRLNISSAQIGRTVSKLGDAFVGLGGEVLKATADLAGSEVELTPKVRIAPEIVEFRQTMRDAIERGDAEGAIAAALDMRQLGKEQGLEFSLGIAEAIEDARAIRGPLTAGLPIDTTQAPAANPQAEQLRDLDVVKVMNDALVGQAEIVEKVDGQWRKLVGFVEESGGKIRATYEEVKRGAEAIAEPVAIPVQVEPDAFQRDLEESLASISLPKIGIETELLPPDVREAQAVLERVQAKAAQLRQTGANAGKNVNTRGALPATEVQEAIAAQRTVAQFETASAQAEDLLGSLRIRSLDGLVRQRAESEEIVKQTERRIVVAEKLLGQDSKIVVALREQLALAKERADEKIDTGAERAAQDIQSRTLALRLASVDRAGQLATAVGDVAAADLRGVEAIELRAVVARRAADREIADLRERSAGNQDALDAIEAYAAALRGAADDEARLAQEARGRALRDRDANTDTAVADAEAPLLSGYDAELDAIERNRAARILAAEEDIRTGKIRADALARLIVLYDQAADRDRALAEQNAARRDAEDIAGMIREASSSYADQVGALNLLRSVSRDRYAEELRNEGLAADAIRERLALYDELSGVQVRDLTISFAEAPATQLAEKALLDSAYDKAKAAGDAYIRTLEEAGASTDDLAAATVEWSQKTVEAVTRAREGMDAFREGLAAGIEDFRREVGDNFSFAANAGQETGRTFRDSLSDALQGKRNAGESIFDSFLRANLENLQTQAADFAANQISSLIFGAPEGNDAGTPDERLGLAAGSFQESTVRFDSAVLRFEAVLASLPVGGGASVPGFLSPVGESSGGVVLGPGIFGGGAPLAPDQGTGGFSGADFVSVPDDFDPGLAASPDSEAIVAAGDAFASAVEAGGQRTASAIVNGGDVFGSLLTGLAGSFGSSISSFLTGAISGSFAEGGRFKGRSMRTLSPLANRLGGKYTNRTLIEVAEVPGLEEAVIPLKGGAIPIEVKPGGKKREDPRLRNGPFDDLVQQLGRLDLQEQRLRADAPAEREREKARERSDFAVRQADTRRAPVGERKRVGIGADAGERRSSGRGRPSVVQSQPVIHAPISIHIDGSQSSDPGADLLRVMPEIEKRLAATIANATNRQLINAIRGAGA